MDGGETKGSSISSFTQMELLLSFGLLVILGVIIVPLPTVMLDTFLAANLGASIVLLLVTLNISHPLEISVFPSLLLLITLARLSLNVATTRLILLNADAGKIVSTFGGFVVGGDIVVGLVIFLILVIIQFIVITKGASRISEVAARFALDALPGKQMAIDSELSAGTIDDKEAKKKRDMLSLETEFYGSMDGAGKFVRGDAMAGLAITAINLVGGVIIGMSKGLSISAAIRTYSILTVGDGLVSQIPGLIIATMAGLLVTKASSRISLGKEIEEQVTKHSHTLLAGSVIVGSLVFVPGLPKLPFLGLAIVMFVMWLVRSRKKEKPDPTEPEDKSPKTAPANPLERHVQEFLQTDQACLEIGVRLVPLVDPNHDRGLTARIADLRSELASKYGIWVPAVRIRDNIRQLPNLYRIIIAGREIAKAELEPDCLLAISTATSSGTLEGTPTKDPAFGLAATWIQRNQKNRAVRLGYTVVDPTMVLITHLREALRANAPDLLSREDLRKLLDELKNTAPTLVNEITTDVIREADVHKVLRQLLAERVPIKNLGLILESVLQNVNQTKSPEALAELARIELGRETVEQYRDDSGKLHAAIIEPQLEVRLRELLKEGVLMIPPGNLERLTRMLHDSRQMSLAHDQEIVLLCDSSIRRALRNSLDRALPEMMIIGYSEIPREIDVDFKKVLTLQDVFPNTDLINDSETQLNKNKKQSRAAA